MYLNSLGNITPCDADVYVKLNSSDITEAAINKNKTPYQQKTGFKFLGKAGKVVHLEHSFVSFWNLDTLENRSETSGKFWNVLLEKDGDQLDRSCEKCRCVTLCQVE